MLRSIDNVDPKTGEPIDRDPGREHTADLLARRRSALRIAETGFVAPARDGITPGIPGRPRWTGPCNNPYDMTHTREHAYLFPGIVLWSDGPVSVTGSVGDFSDISKWFDFLGITVINSTPVASGLIQVRLPEGMHMDPNGFFIGDAHMGYPMYPIHTQYFAGTSIGMASALNLGLRLRWFDWASHAKQKLPNWVGPHIP
jgi:hypothetical protein